jgi:DNA-binding transcriptional MerR regulator
VHALDIAEVADRSGVPASRLRYYEERGLIAPVGRRGLRRVFEPGVLERLALIALGRSAGFSLDEIGRMVTPGHGPKIDRALLSAKAGDLDQTIRRLTAMRDGLRHAAVCPARSHMECPSFQRLLKLAASGAIERVGRAAPEKKTRARPEKQAPRRRMKR